MNWFKTAQQGLLFYPWNKSYGLSVYPQPSMVDSNGTKYYKCDVCGRNVLENEIEEVVEPAPGAASTPSEKFSYPFQHIDDLKELEYELEKLWAAIKPVFEESRILYMKLMDFDYQSEEWQQVVNNAKPLNIKNILQVYNSSPAFKEVCSMISNVYGLQVPYHLKFLDDLNSGLVGAKDFDFNRFNYFIENKEGAIKDILDIVEYYKSFSVAKQMVVCNECVETSIRCFGCDEPIFDLEDTYLLAGEEDYTDKNGVEHLGDRVCRKCLENGEYDVCSGCGKAAHHDEMEYFEYLEENYCSDCAENVIRDYEEVAYEVEEIAQRNPRPFKDWFTEGDRIYLPFSADYKQPGLEDERIVQYLRSNECSVSYVDYQNGYCTYQNRKFRIGKFLEKMKYDNDNKIKQRFKDDLDLQKEELDESKIVFDEMLSDFASSPYRKLKNQTDKRIVISQDPHDIAKMSTGRNWKSCMNLDRGSGKQDDVFCEVEEGGLIAYLIDQDDEEVENPYARILIRRFENKNGISIAVPEKSVYGSAPNSFYDQVKDWLEDKQKSLPKDEYQIRGMEYRDTLSSIYRKIAAMLARRIVLSERENMIMKKAGWYGKVKTADRKKEVKLFGKLKQSPDGFTYLKVSNNIINGFFMSIKEEGAEKPPYDTKAMNNTGAHATVFYSDEVKEKKLDIKEIGQEFSFKVGKMYSVNPDGWKEMERVWFLEIFSPELENLRKKYGLSKLVGGHQYHLTIAVQKKK